MGDWPGGPQWRNWSSNDNDLILHASAVDVAGAGILLLGGSGVGKSSLALDLMAFGATLVGDDRIQVQVQKDKISLSAPHAIAGRIEARGLGVLPASYVAASPLFLAVHLRPSLDHRYQDCEELCVQGHGFLGIEYIYKVGAAAAIWQLVKSKRGPH